MTDKQESILETALELFATVGYNATSTSKIARQAGVSEGLIFRHFTNKKGLLQALIKEAEERIGQLFAPIIFEDDPKEVIRKTILLPFNIDQSEYNFWKLQFKLKWEEEYNNPNKMKPVIDKLSWAFGELGFEDPANEALLLNQLLDAIGTGILRDGYKSQTGLKDLLLSKYGV